MLKIISERKELIEIRGNIKEKSIGFIPTMGNLHEGHLSLIKESQKNHRTSFVSIFVNPKQFGPKEDFKKYPRTLESDIDQIKAINKSESIYLFCPQSNNEIYPEGYNTSISVQDHFTKILCGASRPNHFTGVTTVLYQLFHLIRPSRVYMGQKDLQQVRIVEKFVRDLCLNLEIVSLPTARDSSGLALSSRNQYLDKNQKVKALNLIDQLKTISTQIQNLNWIENFDLSFEEINSYIKEVQRDPNWEYLHFLDAQNLSPVERGTQSIAILGAYLVNGTRLIDNIIVPVTTKKGAQGA